MDISDARADGSVRAGHAVYNEFAPAEPKSPAGT